MKNFVNEDIEQNYPYFKKANGVIYITPNYDNGNITKKKNEIKSKILDIKSDFALEAITSVNFDPHIRALFLNNIIDILNKAGCTYLYCLKTRNDYSYNSSYEFVARGVFDILKVWKEIE